MNGSVSFGEVLIASNNNNAAISQPLSPLCFGSFCLSFRQS